MKLKVGQRDEKGRIFRGWTIRWPWTDKREPPTDLKATRARFAVFDGVACGAEIVRVYRPESKLRRAPRELVREIDDGCECWLDHVDAYKAARELLEES